MPTYRCWEPLNETDLEGKDIEAGSPADAASQYAEKAHEAGYPVADPMQITVRDEALRLYRVEVEVRTARLFFPTILAV